MSEQSTEKDQRPKRRWPLTTSHADDCASVAYERPYPCDCSYSPGPPNPPGAPQ